ncbi:MAG: retroviral-like aspartic protease family protein [Oscillospiraceae bacterium]|jgi:predicted aspartyl protease|nr:retroviral-like aspartic protease family protein [Oscillospiraceae bacterium]
MPVSALTLQYDTLVNRLISKVGIMPHILQKDTLVSANWDAVWDTGATGTTISYRLAETLNLVAVSKMKAHTPSGSYMANGYYIDIYLPNGVKIEKTLAMEANLLDFDVLIGMDIIGLGDFAVSNYRGKTCFTYRIPSMARFDFTKETSSAR